ncbi:MAG: molybdopterin-dependent oxidoreductase [Chloroflexi bacterium]|nr:molybdopterin-dependent oxidoreductase [Chloroflexota bacterium]
MDAGGEDTWVYSTCEQCNANCGIRVRRVGGVVVKIEGDPDCPHDWGRLCAKGLASLMSLYDPYRVTTPLKRTNPQKGLGVDPAWVEISWEEALDTVAQKLREIRETDPGGLIVVSWDNNVAAQMARPWASAFGTPEMHSDFSTYSCGIALHPLTYLTNGTFQQEIDLDYCRYCLLIGNQFGFGASINSTLMAQKMADARMRGLKVVVVDPVGSNAAAKADEWIPIRPGTDAALALVMVNLLLNEYHLYDAPFIAKHTNGAYLIDDAGNYVRDKRGGKPLVWDMEEERAVPFDAGAGKVALEGEFVVEGLPCRPAFQLLKEHVAKYTPETVADITTVPAETIRRIAREFGEAACIGATLVIKGVELPYRPAAAMPFKGVVAHRHATLSGLAVQLLNLVVGGMYAVGGYRGVNLIGPFSWWQPQAEADGLLVTPRQLGRGTDYYGFRVRPPETMGFAELLPLAIGPEAIMQLNFLEPERFQELPHKPLALIHCRHNFVMNSVNPEQMAEILRRIPFMVSFAVEMDETAEFADIVLPDCHQLERLNIFPNRLRINVSPLSGYYYWTIQQPVVSPRGQARSWRDVLIELADRAGFLPDFNIILNTTLELKEPYRLRGEEKYSYPDIADRWAKSIFGPQVGLDWFREHGCYRIERTVVETYPSANMTPRFPIYFEIVQRRGEEVRRVTEELGLPWDTSDYQALPDWKPCHAFQEDDPDYDLFVANYKIPIHFQTVTAKNPWLSEVAENHPYAYKILVNADTAKKKGIRDGDSIWVESVVGRVRGMAKATECIHPEVVGISGGFGAWAKGKPVARGKGAHFNTLLPLRPEQIDWISSAIDECVKVKIYKSQG